MKFYEFGPYFVQRLFWTTRWHKAVAFETSQEIEPPFRHGKSVVFGLPFLKTAIVIGKWEGMKNETDALLSAMDGRVTLDNGIDIDEFGEDL